MFGDTETVKAPRGFTLIGSDHFGPNRFLKENTRGRWLIRTARAETGAYSRTVSGWQLYLSTDRGWVPRSGIEATPCEAWRNRRK